jgi:Golgi nucleoside diphosphatase
VRTLFPKHPVAPCTKSSCSFGGHFALPLAQHAAAALSDARRGKIYAFSYFYDRTLEIFELEEESAAEPDGTILRLERIRQLADTICSFSMRRHGVRSIAEIEREKAAAFDEKVATLQARGCKVIRVRDEAGLERDIISEAPAGDDVVDEGECMIEEKPDLTPQGEEKHARISSPFVALLSENPYLCLDLTYAHTLLHYGYDLPESTDLHIMKRLQKKEIGWCLGAMLSQMAQRGW